MSIPLSDSFLDKSWLFEIYNTMTSTVEESFTLIMPPNTVVIKEPQRVNIQKTFNNAFVDDYGPDNLEIEIRAVSGTTSVFPTFQTSTTEASSPEFGAGYSGFGNPSTQAAATAASTLFTTNVLGSVSSVQPTGGYDGRSAFYQFRDKIMRYKDLGNFEYKELRVYDLFDAQAYKCILLDFELERSSRTPIWYPFTIRLFVYARMDNSLSFVMPTVPLATGEPNQLLSDVNTFCTWMQTAGNLFASVRNACGTALADGVLLSARLNSAVSTAVSIALTPLQLASKLVSDSVAICQAFYGIYLAGNLQASEYASYLEVAHSNVHRCVSLWGYAAQTQGNASASQTVIYDGGLSLNSSDFSGSSNDRTPVIDSRTFNGYKTYVVGGADTLQRIALNQLGNETLWPFIALANNIVGNSELVATSTIYIPIVVSSSQFSDPYIVSSDPSYDPLGTDIALDSEGNLLVGGNDLITVTGINNLIQSINTRLQTEAGQLIKETTFGITAQVGNAGVGLANSYAQMAVKASLIQDPRITQVSNVRVMLQGDAFYVVANLTVPSYPKIIPLYTVV